MTDAARETTRCAVVSVITDGITTHEVLGVGPTEQSALAGFAQKIREGTLPHSGEVDAALDDQMLVSRYTAVAYPDVSLRLATWERPLLPPEVFTAVVHTDPSLGYASKVLGVFSSTQLAQEALVAYAQHLFAAALSKLSEGKQFAAAQGTVEDLLELFYGDHTGLHYVLTASQLDQVRG